MTDRHPAPEKVAAPFLIFRLANIIRQVDRNHDLGAGELADRLLRALNAAGYDVARIEEGERPLDVTRLRGAFIRAGIVWVLPAALFEEAVEVVAREYGAALAASDEAAK